LQIWPQLQCSCLNKGPFTLANIAATAVLLS
jgi:hypothetical protein